MKLHLTNFPNPFKILITYSQILKRTKMASTLSLPSKVCVQLDLQPVWTFNYLRCLKITPLRALQKLSKWAQTFTCWHRTSLSTLLNYPVTTSVLWKSITIVNADTVRLKFRRMPCVFCVEKLCACRWRILAAMDNLGNLFSRRSKVSLERVKSAKRENWVTMQGQQKVAAPSLLFPQQLKSC